MAKTITLARKATTVNKPGQSKPGKTLPDVSKADAKALAKLGGDIAEAYHTAQEVKRAAEAPLLSFLREAAKKHAGMTAAQYDEHVHPAVIAGCEARGYAMPKVIASQMKVAFLGFAHGVAVPAEVASNFQKYVNDVARPALTDAGIVKAKKAKEPKAGAIKGDVWETSLGALSGVLGGDKEARTWRKQAVKAVLEHDPKRALIKAKLAEALDAVLEEMLDTLDLA